MQTSDIFGLGRQSHLRTFALFSIDQKKENMFRALGNGCGEWLWGMGCARCFVFCDAWSPKTNLLHIEEWRKSPLEKLYNDE